MSLKKKVKSFIIGLFISIFILVVIYWIIGANVLYLFTENFMLDAKEIKIGGITYIEGKLDWIGIKNNIFFFIFLLYIVVFIIINLIVNRKENELKASVASEVQDRIQSLKDGVSLKSDSLFLGIDNEVKSIIDQRDRMYKINKEVDIQYNQSMAFLAHDLKTPLTSIIGYITLLIDEPTISQENRNKYLNIVLEKSIELEDLIQQFFQLARYKMESKDLIKKEVDLYNLMIQIRETFYPEVSEKKLNVNLEIEPKSMIFVDSKLISRAFYNLFKNAVFYTKGGGEIHLTYEHCSKYHKIVLENEAPDFKEENIFNIFDPFYRIETSRNKEKEGTGLGLAITKEIIEKHDGSIIAEYEDNNLKFIINLPI